MDKETKQIFAQLKKAGSAQTRKTYGRHGVTGEMFGVSYADLGRLKKKIKVNHEMAIELWETGNHDAQVLASMIADPDQATVKQINDWASSLNNYVITDAFSKYVHETKFADKKMTQWMNARKEYLPVCGWTLLALKATKESEPDSNFDAYLETIEASIHSERNRTRQAMNNALIAIGIRNSKMEKKAIRVARKVGKVEVDHGDTSCKTPDAESYIKNARSRAKK